MAVAERVAREQGEEVGQGLVGYAIRGERKASAQCRLLFATTGVLLRRLATGDDLTGVSHVFIDECHERSCDSDFLLLELQSLLARNQRLKIVLMSATIDERTFSQYFDHAPARSIAGRTHPVSEHFLEQLLPRMPSYRPDSSRRLPKIRAEDYSAMQSAFRAQGVAEDSELNALCHLARLDGIDYELLGATVAMIAESSEDGGVLVFVPGVAEIGRAIDAIRTASRSAVLDILPLHANLSPKEQSRVFRPPSKGSRKVVVSTNVAETSITIDDARRPAYCS